MSETKNKTCQFKSKYDPNYKCPEPPLEDSQKGYCIFHEPSKDKDVKKFNEGIRRKLDKQDYDFRGHHFPENASFNSFTFTGKTDFEEATFYGDAFFHGTIFQGKAIFFETEFQGKAIFLVTKFQGEADFAVAEFQREASFQGVEFRGDTRFAGAEFQRKAIFSETKFQKEVDFTVAEFQTRSSISPECIKEYILFTGANLENTSLTPLNLDENAWVDFGDAMLKNTDMRRQDIESHIVHEQDKNFLGAKEIYLLLKNNFHSLGRYDDESWAFRKEKEMERRSFRHFRKKCIAGESGIGRCLYLALLHFVRVAKYFRNRWLPSSLKKTDRLFPYIFIANFLQDPHPIALVKREFENLRSSIKSSTQEKMGKVSRKISWKVLWIYLKYSLKYSWSTVLKYLYGWGEQPWLIFFWCLVTILIFSGIYLKGDIVLEDGSIARSYLDKLFFSGITFTTLGFGGYSPVGWVRLFAFLESFLGIFLIALFVFSFARRTAGR